MIVVGNKYEIIKSAAGNNGKIVTVTGYAGIFAYFTPIGDRWFVDSGINTILGITVNHVGEYQLKPIDEEDGRKVISWEEMKDVWMPESVCA